MDKKRRKELAEQYKEIKTMMGAYEIRNTRNGKVYIGVSSNLKNQWMRLCMHLDSGRFVNAALQKDWTEIGAEAFTYTVLEEKEAKPEDDKRWELKQMEKRWLQKCMPYGDKGYHREL